MPSFPVLLVQTVPGVDIKGLSRQSCLLLPKSACVLSEPLVSWLLLGRTYDLAARCVLCTLSGFEPLKASPHTRLSCVLAHLLNHMVSC